MFEDSNDKSKPDKCDDTQESAQHDVYIKIWAKAVDTQMHFNEMSVKSRQLGLAFVAAALGVGVVLLGRDADFALLMRWGEKTIQIHIAVILLLGAVIAILAVRVLDLGVYHKMLRGAVTFGEDFEEIYMKRVFDLDKGMTQSISHFSRFKDASVTSVDREKKRYHGTIKKSAEAKIKRFYNFVTASLIIGIISLFTVTNQSMLADLLVAISHLIFQS